jgi:colanic acid/amylovoran biosynthesis glycosyltransferase
VNPADYAFKERRYVNGDNVNLLTVARLAEKKGLEYSLQAMARLLPKYSNLFYRIAGDGPLRPELEDMVRRLDLEKVVAFLGPIEHGEVERLMMASDIFILSSVTAKNGDEEGIPNTLKEALASGMPVLSSFHSGIPELVMDGVFGFLIPERDVDALAERLDYLIQHPELWPEMGLAGHRFVEENYDIRKLNLRLVEIYQGLVEKRGIMRIV